MSTPQNGGPATAQEAIIHRDRTYLWSPWSPVTPDESRVILSHGRGCQVWDISGRRYIDAVASAMNSVCGYGHPDISKAIVAQLGRLTHVDLSVSGHEPSGLLAERIASLMPDGLSRTFFVNSGSEAADAAVQMAAAYWANRGEPRRRIVTFERGYHGSTLLSRSLSGLPPTGHPLADPLEVTRVPLPLPAREIRSPAGLEALTSAFAAAISEGGEPPMAVLVEPLLNVGGAICLPRGFLRELRSLCDACGALMIIDEVFTGFGRTGTLFGFEHERITPDIVTASKGLASGYVPIGAITATEQIFDSFRADPILGGFRYGHTTSGHAVACAAGLATIDLLLGDGLAEQAAKYGRMLLDSLAPLADAPGVRDVRGLGLIVAIEAQSPDLALGWLKRARELGLLLRRQHDVLMAVPPLIVDEAELGEIADGFSRAVTAGRA